jgi:hypothetical protein
MEHSWRMLCSGVAGSVDVGGRGGGPGRRGGRGDRSGAQRNIPTSLHHAETPDAQMFTHLPASLLTVPRCSLQVRDRVESIELEQVLGGTDGDMPALLRRIMGENDKKYKSTNRPRRKVMQRKFGNSLFHLTRRC